MLSSGKAYSTAKRSPSPLMFQYYGTEYLGAAHGLCSILQMLLSIPGFADSEEARLKNDPEGNRSLFTIFSFGLDHNSFSGLIEGSVRFLVGLQTPSGNFPCAMDEVPGMPGARLRPDSEELVHWCHGAPGTIYLMAKSYLVFRDDLFLQVGNHLEMYLQGRNTCTNLIKQTKNATAHARLGKSIHVKDLFVEDVKHWQFHCFALIFYLCILS